MINLWKFFIATFRSLIDYVSPVFVDAGKGKRLIRLCERAFRIIHGSDEECNKCTMTDVPEKRRNLLMRLFNKARNDSNNLLNRLLPPTSRRSNRIILPTARTSRRVNAFIISCSVFYNNRLYCFR